ncbi:hypothetical protein DFP72DRAFT_1173198 [Ephemerocybe angulata]|uniref:MYND-type domain-containing protein n=1 Tax=Ephemerocybe angulata TaxID=980116 RepID=A0A8H6HP28_9AGAR|nr:hypothetical protein DFP72DRAFT_1173198 [Tulosesus angulatus]
MHSTQADFRVEALLNAAERRSIPHLVRLKKEWPTDISLGRRALIILLEIFKTEAHHLHSSGSQLYDDDMKCTVKLAQATLAGLDGVFEMMYNNPGGLLAQTFVPIVQLYLREYIAWLRFFVVNPKMSGTGNAIYAGLQATVRLAVLMKGGLLFTEDSDTLEAITDFSLFLWIEDGAWNIQKKGTYSYEEFRKFFGPRYDPLGLCVRHAPARKSLNEKLNSAPKNFLELLCETYTHQCLECLKPRDEPGWNSQPFSLYVHDVLLLSNKSPGFFKVVLKSNFPGLALRLALESRQAPSHNMPWKPLVFEIAHYLFDTAILLVDGARRLVAQLLDAGLLEAIIDDLVSPFQGNSPSLQGWRFEGTHPLKVLLSASYDRRIAKALDAAISSISAPVLEKIALRATAREIWEPFVRDFQPYRDALCLSNPSNDSSGVCDSFLHPYGSVVNSTPKQMRECATCKTTTYCSTECQREDWTSFHRHGCIPSRIERIDQQLQGSWISHRTRMFNLMYLAAVLNSGFSPEGSDGWVEKRVCIVDRNVHPASIHCNPLEHMALYSRLCFDLFEDARSQEMLRQAREDNYMALAICFSTFGRCGIIVFASFSVESPAMTGQEGVGPTFHLRGGFCQAVDSSEIPNEYLII